MMINHHPLLAVTLVVTSYRRCLCRSIVGDDDGSVGVGMARQDIDIAGRGRERIRNGSGIGGGVGNRTERG